MKNRVLALVAALVCAAPAASLASQPSTHLRAEYTSAYNEVRSLPAAYPAGCNLLEHKCADDRNPSAQAVTQSLGVLEQEIAAYQAASTPAPTNQTASNVANNATSTTSDVSSVSSGGGGGSSSGYCGAYQFDQSTWSSVGMPGSPCGASPAAQDQAAQRLMAQRGNQPWPVCGAGHGTTDLAAIRQCENSGSYAP